MAEKEYKAFRDATLAGCDPAGRDTPAARAAGAAEYHDREAAAAVAAEESAVAALRKAERQVEAAQDAVKAAQEQARDRAAEAEHAHRLVAELGGVKVSAGVAGATGEAKVS